jgi:hypothetical protein
MPLVVERWRDPGGSFTDILVAAEVAIDEVAEMQSGLRLRRSGLQAREADRG